LIIEFDFMSVSPKFFELNKVPGEIAGTAVTTWAGGTPKTKSPSAEADGDCLSKN
jgi:hypothetical protein